MYSIGGLGAYRSYLYDYGVQLQCSIHTGAHCFKSVLFLTTLFTPTPGSLILQQAREQLASAGVSSVTGLHEPEVQEPPPLTPNALAQASSNEHINLLEEHGELHVIIHRHCGLRNASNK